MARPSFSMLLTSLKFSPRILSEIASSLLRPFQMAISSCTVPRRFGVSAIKSRVFSVLCSVFSVQSHPRSRVRVERGLAIRLIMRMLLREEFTLQDSLPAFCANAATMLVVFRLNAENSFYARVLRERGYDAGCVSSVH